MEASHLRTGTLVLVFLSLWTDGTAVADDSDIRELLSVLRRNLVTRQHKWIPPFEDNSTYVNVSLSFSPFTILDLDSAKETLAVGAYLRFGWKDKKLTWSSEDYNGCDLVEINSDEVWSPKIILSNSVSDLGPIETKIPLVVKSNGLIGWQVNSVFRSSCKINVDRYPFDTQECRVLFAPVYGYSIAITLDDSYILSNEDFVDENGEWKLLNITQKLVQLSNSDFTIAEYILTLARKPLYYVINFMYPMVLLSVLNPFVFLIPARSGEKLGFLMAVFVSHALFLNLIHQTVPPTSDTTSRLSLYLALLEMQGFLTIFCTIVVLIVHHRKEGKVGTTLSQTDDTKEKQWSLERKLDSVFFVLSLAIAGCSFLILMF